jgi:hypothetical protein
MKESEKDTHNEWRDISVYHWKNKNYDVHATKWSTDSMQSRLNICIRPAEVLPAGRARDVSQALCPQLHLSNTWVIAG